MNYSKDLTLRFSYELIECLCELIDKLLEQGPADNDDELLLAVLADFNISLKQRLIGKAKSQYQVNMNAPRAIAMRNMYLTCTTGENTWFRNELRVIAEQIHAKYSH